MLNTRLFCRWWTVALARGGGLLLSLRYRYLLQVNDKVINIFPVPLSLSIAKHTEEPKYYNNHWGVCDDSYWWGEKTLPLLDCIGNFSQGNVPLLLEHSTLSNL